MSVFTNIQFFPYMYGGREEDAYFASPWCKGNNFHNLDSSFPKDASYRKCNTRPDTFFC